MKKFHPIFLYNFIYFFHNNSGDYMKNTKYDKIADQHKATENRLFNVFIAFVVGGLIGLIGEALICFYSSFGISRRESSTLMSVSLIFVGSLCTALGFFDKLVTKFKCGLLIPITGFAHSMTSAALEYKNEGLVLGIGANIFKLAGTVVLYGVISVYIFGLIRIMLGGI